MERVQKKQEPIPATESIIQKKQEAKANDTENVKSKSFMESSDSVLGASNKSKMIEPPMTLDVWFPADGTVLLDALQLSLLSQLASDTAITSGAASITGIKGGARTNELTGSDLGGVLEVANLRAIAVDNALGNPGVSYVPSDQTVTDYKTDVISTSDAEKKFINGSEVKVTILFNTERRNIITRLKNIALQIDSHTR